MAAVAIRGGEGTRLGRARLVVAYGGAVQSPRFVCGGVRLSYHGGSCVGYGRSSGWQDVVTGRRACNGGLLGGNHRFAGELCVMEVALIVGRVDVHLFCSPLFLSFFFHLNERNPFVLLVLLLENDDKSILVVDLE